MAQLIARAVGAEGDEASVRDLLFHLPSSAIDRRFRPPLYQLPPSGTVTVEGTVERCVVWDGAYVGPDEHLVDAVRAGTRAAPITARPT